MSVKRQGGQDHRGAWDSVERQWGIGAVEEFDCREHQFGVTHVFEVVKEVFAFGEVKVACLAGYVGNFACGSVGRMLSARSGIDGGPKVIQHVPVGSHSLSWLQTDLPDADPVGFAQ